MSALLRLIYIAWIIGAIVVFLRGLSQMLFGRGAAGSTQFFRAIFMAIVWPIALMTPEGRAALRALARAD